MFNWPWLSKKKMQRTLDKAECTVVKLKKAKNKLDKALDELEGILRDGRQATTAPEK